MRRLALLVVSLLSIATMACLLSSALAQTGGDTKRRTVAVTYLKDPVKVVMAGTTLRPDARGEATVERWRKRSESEIDITVEKLIPAFNYGADYNTYVLWAITPEGQVSNLGEFRLSGGTGHLKQATPFQTFAMIITAEPHFMVKLPSRKVVMENLAPNSKNVQVQSSEIFFTGDSGRYYTDDSIPITAERDYNKTPPELLQARRAVQIARIADGERYDSADFRQAVEKLQDAETAFRRGAPVHEVGRIGRESIALAVRTRDISEDRAVSASRRAEIARRDEEVRRANESAAELESKLTNTDTRLRASEIARTDAQERLNGPMREAADAQAENRSLQSQVARLRAENDRLTQDLSETRARLSDLESQRNADRSRLDEAKSHADAMERAERERREAEARRRDYADLQAALGRIVTVKSNVVGFVVVLPDTFFVANKTDLALRAKAKMDALSQSIAAHPDATFTIEGHSDSRPTADSFAMGRANSVAEYIAGSGVPRANFKVDSRGASVPIASNKALRGRASNRRVEINFAAPK
jgi:outer membrane protein OmpA-like peptidoglycan-associated protein